MSTKAEKKARIKTAIKALLAKVAEAVVKLVKTRLLPKAEEKYAKALKATQEKFIDKVDDLIDDIEAEDNEKKKATLFVVLKFCVETMEAVGNALLEAVAKTKAEVNFEEFEQNEEVKVALAKIDEAMDIEPVEVGGCGEDGCEIA